MHPDLEKALGQHGVLKRSDHPHLGRELDKALAAGELVRVLPGVSALPHVARSLEGRARAVTLYDADAVITGQAAGRLTGFSVREPTEVTVASPHRRRPTGPFMFERRSIPRNLTRKMDGYRVTSRVMTALDLYDGDGAFEWALRKGVSPDDIAMALAQTKGRPGNQGRRRKAHQTRDQPWSTLEQKAHAHLRRGRVRGWKANAPLFDQDGILIAKGDLVFHAHGLIIEINGHWHGTRKASTNDAARNLALRLEGWEVIPFEAEVVGDTPREFVKIVRGLLASRVSRLAK